MSEPKLKSFVEFVGVYKEQPTPQYRLLSPQPSSDQLSREEIKEPSICARQNFTVGHDGPEDLAEFINKAFCELAMLGGMMVHAKEPHQRFDFNNQIFIPMHMLSRIECAVKRITDRPENPDVLDAKETIN